MKTSLFIINVFPDTSLKITFKFNTNDTSLIDSIENGGSLYFGMDFMYANTDITVPNLRVDIIKYSFLKINIKCFDYVFDIVNEIYMPNNQLLNSKSDKNKI
jgi:hypothetical protein